MLTVAISIIDVLGTLAFALSGALLGVRKRFDLFGILFLSFVAGITGGLMRDVLIGALPPAAFANVHYSLIAIAAGLITFFWYRSVAAWARLILLVDAVGLAMFSVAGAQKAIEFGINPPMAALLGMLTGIGGGMARDILAGEIPFVLQRDLYAIAALAGAAIVSGGHVLAVPSLYALLMGAAACILLRVMAIYRGWKLPTRTEADDGPG